MEQSEQPKSKRGILILVTIVVLLLAGVTVYALQNSQSDDDSMTAVPTQTETTVVTPETTTDEAAPAPSERMVITHTDDGFSPSDVTVKVGTTIAIMNKASKNVQFSSDDHPVHQDNEEMNLSALRPEASATYTASKVGSWGFHDHIDDSKTGTVTVTE